MSGWLLDFLIAIAPLALLVALLIRGRYPGEAAIDRCRRAIRLLLEPGRSKIHRDESRLAPTTLARGGRLIAASLAGRGPPFGLKLPV